MGFKKALTRSTLRVLEAQKIGTGTLSLSRIRLPQTNHYYCQDSTAVARKIRSPDVPSPRKNDRIPLLTAKFRSHVLAKLF